MLVTATGIARHTITLDKLKRFMEFEDILRDLHWTIACLKCRNPVAGNNDPTSQRLAVSCKCAEHVFDGREP